MRYSMNWSSARLPGLVAVLVTLVPASAFAQTSPFLTGATSLQTNIQAWATPFAIIMIMVFGVMAMAQRMSWSAAIACIVGTAVLFGAPQLLTWIRGMFGV